MATARSHLTKAFVLAAAAIAIAFLSIAYTNLSMLQQLTAIYLVKVLLGILAALFLIIFQLKWVFSRHDLSVLSYYTKWKLFKHKVAEGIGIILLAAAFFLEFAIFEGWIYGTAAVAITNALEVVALMCFGYSYYRLMRLEGA